MAVIQTTSRDRTHAVIASAAIYRIDGLKTAGVQKSRTMAVLASRAATTIAITGDTRLEILSMIML
jgi:hypothetical protein